MRDEPLAADLVALQAANKGSNILNLGCILILCNHEHTVVAFNRLAPSSQAAGSSRADKGEWKSTAADRQHPPPGFSGG